MYRLGHKGKVDLKYVQDAVGGCYYRDHLPILGELKKSELCSCLQCLFCNACIYSQSNEWFHLQFFFPKNTDVHHVQGFNLDSTK